MYGLPQAADVRRRVPKAQLFRKTNLSPEDRRVIDETASRIEIVGQISPQTVPALAAGERVKSIFVMKADLKTRTHASRFAALLLGAIPQHIVLALSFAGETRLVVRYGETIESPLFDDEDWERRAPLTVRGADLGAVWLRFVGAVAGLEFGDETVTDETLSAKLRRRAEDERTEARIARLEKQLRAEVQPRRKYDLHRQISALKSALTKDRDQ